MRSGFLRGFGGVVVGLTVAAAARPALAQSTTPAPNPGLALDRFEPAPAGDRMFGVPSPYAAGALTPHLMLLADYAHDPLVLRVMPANTSAGSVVGSQLYLNLDAGLSLWNRLMIDVDVPVALAQSGDNPTGQGETFTSPSSVQFGDLRLGARVPIWGKYDDAFQVAVGGYLWLPTGASNSFVSAGEVRGLPMAIVGGRIANRLVYSAAIGPEVQGTSTYGSVEQGSMFRWGLGAGVLLLDDRHLQVGAEASGEVLFRDVEDRTTNAELLFDARYRFLRNFEVAAGLGPGLTSGIGTPDFRGILSVAFTPEPSFDRDGDGVPDTVDACPDEKGVATSDPMTNGCPPPPPPPPPPDRDGDGILDMVDACPDVPGVASADPAKNGCPPPPDRDGDGIIDSQDACPDVKGVADPDPKKNGCPPPADRDHDGILDADDACPDEPGQPSSDPKRNGCPMVHVTDKEVVILEQVQFETGKAAIKKESFGLLDAVASVLKTHPELLRLEVQGHTDNKGAKPLNKKLSQDRATSVMKALIARGVDKSRLTAQGYGQDKPIADNGTEMGRQMNRRVQFNILEKKPKPAP
jgi:outer membrane protein OmpA-like peptidoglycan-associated protein